MRDGPKIFSVEWDQLIPEAYIFDFSNRPTSYVCLLSFCEKQSSRKKSEIVSVVWSIYNANTSIISNSD